MADHAAVEGGNNDVFIYMGGDEEVPRDVTHAIVDPSVDTIRRRAFWNCTRLVSIAMHDDVKIIELEAFQSCVSLKRINLLGVKVIQGGAFADCRELEDVEFGNKLDIIGSQAFLLCHSLRNIKIPKVREIWDYAFAGCQFMEADLPEDLERIGIGVFQHCRRLRRIVIPLKDLDLDDNVFNGCVNLSRVDLIGGIHKTISSLYLESWRIAMNDEIDRINQTLPNIDYYDKTESIREWITIILQRIEHYKAEHYAFLKEAISLLELALWRAALRKQEREEHSLEEKQPAKRAKIIEECGAVGTVEGAKSDFDAARRAARVTCGADIIIKNVLPFLNDDVEFPLLTHDSSTHPPTP